MKIGTKSVLFGAHAFWLHPWFVAIGWWILYGFPWDPRLWVAFFVHDLGYWGKPNMDGPEGERHVHWGAQVMGTLFDARRWDHPWWARPISWLCNRVWGEYAFQHSWFRFCFYHSRFMAKDYQEPVSKLCFADKLALVLTPWWLYLPMVNLTGEIHEYMKLADTRHAAGEPRIPGKYEGINVFSADQRQWYANVQEYLKHWVAEHMDGGEDTWTPCANDVAK